MMSTRSQVRFISKYKYKDNDGEEVHGQNMAQVYKHSDGYPSGMIEELKDLFEIHRVTGRGIDDASYMAGNFLFLGKLRYMDYLFREYKKDFDTVEREFVKSEDLTDVDKLKELTVTPQFLLGYGVEDPRDGIHGDEEWIYEVILRPWKEREYDETEGAKVIIKISSRFPTMTENREDAFEKADWDFEGTLEEAYNEYILEEESE